MGFADIEDIITGASDIHQLNERVSRLDSAEERSEVRDDLIGDLFRTYGLSAN